MTLHPLAQGFASAAEEYERGRPGYAPEALAWLVERLGLHAGRTVLDLGAGTGKLTRQLVATGADVVAVEPLEEMRVQLEAAVPEARALAGRAEEIPLPDGAVDAVTSAQAFHWFEHGRALAEMSRVLRPGGAIALIWNHRDEQDPLQAALEAQIEALRARARYGTDLDPPEVVAASGLFARPEERRFVHEQRIDRAGALDSIASTSVVATLSPAEREPLLARLRKRLADEPEPVVLRYATEVYVADRI